MMTFSLVLMSFKMLYSSLSKFNNERKLLFNLTLDVLLKLKNSEFRYDIDFTKGKSANLFLFNA